MRGLVGFIAIIFLIALTAGAIYRYKTDVKFESVDSTLTEPADTNEVKILQKDLDI